VRKLMRSTLVGLFLASVVAMSAWFVLTPPLGQSGAPHQTGAAPGTMSTATFKVVAERLQTDRRGLGVNVIWYDDTQNSDVVLEQKARRVFNYIVGLNANAIVISFPIYQRSGTSNTVSVGPGTPTPQRLDLVVRAAKLHGLRVTLRPLMDEQALVPQGYWRGTLAPTNRAAWFRSYWNTVAPYAQLAQRDGVGTFVVGTEFSTLEGDSHWSWLVRQIRTVYSGRLAYSANWDRVRYSKKRIGVPVGLLGFDAYFPVNAPDSAEVSQLKAGWDYWLNRAPRSTNYRKVVLYEVGAPATAGFYNSPWEANPNKPIATQQQVRWFETACREFRSRHMAGIYWWKLDFHTDPVNPDLSDRGSFIGRPAERVIRACFGG